MWNRNTFATSELAIFSTVQKPRLKPFLLTYVLNFNPTSISSRYFFQECFQLNGSIRHTMNRGLFELCRITATMLHICAYPGVPGGLLRPSSVFCNWHLHCVKHVFNGTWHMLRWCRLLLSSSPLTFFLTKNVNNAFTQTSIFSWQIPYFLLGGGTNYRHNKTYFLIAPVLHN